MERAALIVNPNAGRARLFARVREPLERLLREHGYAPQVLESTAAPESAGALARAASAECALVLACGGDGTVHGVLQGVAHSDACLGVLPFGTANALARNLGLAMEPVAALAKLLSFRARVIPLGLATTARGPRWFTVMAGAGPDGRLVHEMQQRAKRRLGRSVYYAEAARLFVTRRFPAFEVAYRALGAEQWSSTEAVAMMASRVPDLGGLFGGLTRASALHHPHLRVQLLRAPAHVSLPLWFAAGRTRLRVPQRWLTTLEVEELRCVPLEGGGETLAQVDGEAAGALPLSLSVVRDGLRMLMPET